ncbi:MAG: metallophosphoesterase family protein [Lentisphaeria bacterium]|nr:metallophosphatase family protein [Lentisphaeria bacterium]NQZ68673.1 metallophosphoesterase family protein [Lentisphaeria bacterium]
MKTLIISDIHANVIALEKVWAEESDADMVVCAGDLVDYGVYPRECIEWIMDKADHVVKGNHDRDVVEAFENPRTEGELCWRDENATLLEQRHIDYLKALPEKLIVDIDGDSYGMTHSFGTGYDIIRSLEAFHEFSDERFSQPLERFIFGHTHRRELHYLSDQKFWLNPGSISYRRNDDPFRGSHYAVIIDGKVSLRSVVYPVDKLHQKVLASEVCHSQKSHTLLWWASE